MPILPKERDPRLITIRRGGTLTDEHHRLLADWALLCAEHVLHLFEDHQPGDSRPGDAIDVGRAWIRGEVRMGDAHRAAFQANAAARGMPDPASSLHCRRARRLRWLTSPPMTWALRRTPSGRPAHASQPTTLRKLGPRSGSGSGCTSLPLSVNSFSTINNAGAPSLLGCGPGSLASLSSDLTPRCRQHTKDYATDHPTRRRQRVHGNSSSVVNTFTVVVSRRRWAPRRVEDGSRWHMQVDAVEHPLSPKDLRSPVAVIAGGDWVFLVLVCAVALRRTARRATLGRWR